MYPGYTYPMLTTSAAARSVLQLFDTKGGQAPRLSDDFQSLFFAVHLDSGHPDGRRSSLRRVSAHRETALAFLARYEWQKNQATKKELSEIQWMSFASLDVEHFFAILRSNFDGLANLVREFASKRGQTPPSFNDLLADCQEKSKLPRLVALLGEETVSLLAACDWFVDLRDKRDKLTHNGATSLALPFEDTVSFVISHGGSSLRQNDVLKFNENLDDFELFMAASFGSLLVLENALCRAIQARRVPFFEGQSWSQNPGYGALCRLLERLASRLSERGV